MLKSFFEQFSNIGVSKKYALKQKKIIRLVNQISLIGALFCIIAFVINIALGLYYTAISPLLSSFLFGINVWLNYKKKHQYARLFLMSAALLSTTLINMVVDLHAMTFYFFLSTFVVGLLLFPEKKERMWILIAHLSCMVLAISVAAQLDEPLMASADPIIFGIMNIILVMGMLYLMVNTITRENRKFEQRTVELLASLTDKNKELQKEQAKTAEKTKALKVTNTNLKREVKERQKMEEALRVSNEALQQFAFVASHDLKEPLRTISSFARLLERRLGENLDPASKEYFHFIVDGVQRMSTLLDDLLAYSRLNTKISFDEMNLMNTIEIIEYSLKNLLERRNGKIVYQNLPNFTANRSQLSQVFQNLISNGLKFNDGASPTVEIACEENTEEYIFSVRDNGIGIAPEYQDKIFMIFQRLHDRDSYEGTGIGLAICKKIIDNHNGRIWLHSTPNVGTTFFFSIPKNLHSGTSEVKVLQVMEAATVKQN